ncbi:MAG TPA: carboxypeptidase regulatory-like domain-containing protein [Acidobacteriaceae bacterium]|nr:carboxypeptidase regulatory-like domain-containing protein [Acidobacteriaceae bacterium]
MNSIRRLASVRLRLPGSLLILSGLLIAAMVLFTAVPAHAQQLTGTLSATVYDTTGAVVPDAAVTLKNSESGDVRRTVTDGAGYFTFTAVQPATYSISISAKGFTTWTLSGITIHLGDTRTVPNIALKAGAASTTVEVVADKNVEVPLDTPEVSTTMNAEQIEDMSLGGRDAGELLKMMPGAAFTNGLGQGSSFNPKVTGTNSGPVGAYSLNGTQPYGAMAYMLDGANLVDPGNAGTQIANINQDMVSEVKVLSGSYDASYAYGPVIFEAFSKSGGKSFHGEGYLYARNSTLNAFESAQKEAYISTLASASNTQSATALASELNPYEYYYYVGGNVGGPVFFPHFNRNHDKLFFWGGYEYMIQHPANQVLYYNQPTADQYNGIFTAQKPASNNNGSYNYAYNLPSSNLPTGYTTDSSGNIHIPTGDFDQNILGVLKYYAVTRAPNITPNAANSWSNFAYAPSIPQNRWEATGKVDYAITENTKLSGTYAYQSETDQHPVTVWWAPPSTLPYPSPVGAKVNAKVLLVNFTHQFNPTTTNEAVFTLSRFINPITYSGNAADRSTIGMGGVKGLFGTTTKQMPNIVGPWTGNNNFALSNIAQEPMNVPFNGGMFGKLARVPQFYDTVSKVLGTHTVKAGAYWAQPYNAQTNGSDDGGGNMGQFNLGWPSNYGTGNVVADFELGRVASYEQQSSDPTDTIKMNQWSAWAQDSWKANKQLTINYGLRLDHIGQWYGAPNGMQVWVPGTYVDSPTAPPNTGLSWHAKDSKIPLSGYKSPLFYADPRVGVIYDLFGTGKTVLRTGIGAYRYQISVNEATTNNVADGPLGIINFTTPHAFQGYANITAGGNPPASVQETCWLCGSSVGADLLGDNRTPLTMTWNVSIDQATKWQSLVELSYVGNHTTGEEFNGGNSDINNLNGIGYGGYFKPDPITNQLCSAASPNTDKTKPNYAPSCVQQDFVPMHNYLKVFLLTHQSYEKYNSLQASWRKNGAKLNFQANYTFSKVMGIWDGDTSNGGGNGTAEVAYSIRGNYGPLGYDHTHIFNIWYIYNLPSPAHNRMLGTLINDWKLSGWNTYQAGAPIQQNTGGNFNSNFQGTSNNAVEFYEPNGLPAGQISGASWFGYSANIGVHPLLTCNPRANLHSGQRFNPSCFQAPTTVGVAGPVQYPYMRGPGYLDNDLSIFKSFPTTESQRMELRVQAQNFVNHPNPAFSLNGVNDLQLQFAPTLGSTNNNTNTTGKPKFTTGQRLMTFSARYFF